MLSNCRRGIIWTVVFAAVAGVGCKHKTPAPAPVASNPAPSTDTGPPPAPKPAVLEFSAEPSTLERGQSALLKWSVGNATEVTIDNGIGTVQSNGSRRIIPSESTTYRLNATGPGGETTAATTVNVTAPPPPSSVNDGSRTGIGTVGSRVASDVQDIYFDYDKSDIRADAQATLQRDADALKRIFADFPNASVVVEGHCDERGSAEYNLALGDQRASSAKNYLVQLGVLANKLTTISYGKERPQCTEATEDCYQRNRRSHIAPSQ